MQKVTAFKTEPKGAYFKMVDEHIFLFGMMASAINFGPDGSLYVANWDGKWQPNLAASGWSTIRRSENRSNENKSPNCSAVISQPHKSDTDRTARPCGSTDRLEAQFELARRDRFDELLGLATDPKGDRLARVCDVGLGQLGADRQRDKRLAKHSFADIDDEIRAQAAKLAGTRADFNNAKTGGSASRQERPQFHAAMALGQAGSSESTSHLFSSQQRQGRLHPARGHYGTDRQR